VTPDSGKAAAYDAMERMRDPSHRHAHPLPELEELGRAAGLGTPTSRTGLTGPLPYAAVLATSFPEEHSRKDLLEHMREDAETGADHLGFRAQLVEGEVLVSYPMSTVIWPKP
jgi:hypothetical protein